MNDPDRLLDGLIIAVLAPLTLAFLVTILQQTFQNIEHKKITCPKCGCDDFAPTIYPVGAHCNDCGRALTDEEFKDLH